MRQEMIAFLVVGAGGFLGSVLRFTLTLLAQRYSVSFPHGTLWANLLGCLVIGVVTTLAGLTEVLSPTTRLFLATGLCGGFTTMSSFVYELMQYVRESDYLLATGYAGLTAGGCVGMFLLGVLATRAILRV